MERTKTPKLVITFLTTTAAMTMESVCPQEHGRLIPIPREISAGCGLAWCAEPHMESVLSDLMTQHQIAYEDKQVILLY